MGTFFGSDAARERATRAYNYIRAHFFDRENGGIVWLLDHKGRILDARKQAYAQAFAIYALTEYHQCAYDLHALETAQALRDTLETDFWDVSAGGYIEALSADWKPLSDQRLSDKDMNAPKTMNTHLHILEAYTNLYRIAPDEASRAALRRILTLFLDRFIASEGHLRLFFDMDWNDLSRSVSCGHDIEASWLIWEAAEVLGDEDLLLRARPIVLALAETARREGLKGGALSYEKGFDGHLDPDGEWWGQAEALVGFINAWRMTGDADWLEAAEKVWAYTKAQYGAGGDSEWTWYAALAPREKIYKAGQWKCPYHNGRAMIELDRLLRET
jgi:mannobiose 2-epimerase